MLKNTKLEELIFLEKLSTQKHIGENLNPLYLNHLSSFSFDKLHLISLPLHCHLQYR